MKTSQLAIASATALAVFSAAAQQPAKKPAKPVSKAASAAPEAAAKTAPAPTPFAPVRWQADAPVSAYNPNEPAKVYDWVVAEISAVPGKPDQFSSTEEKRAYETAVADKLKAIGPLAVLHPCAKKYDGDKQEYEVKTGGFSIDDVLLRDPNPEAQRLRKVTIGRGEVVKDTYTGQNAYGANTEISRTVGEMFALTFPTDANNDPSSAWSTTSTGLSGTVPYRLRYGAYLFKVPMPPAEAREQDKNIACLYVFTVTSPGPFKFTERTRPTRDLPFETTFNFKALMGTFDMLAIVNTASGQVYGKATRQGFAAP